jgi:hypothetical protein
MSFPCSILSGVPQATADFLEQGHSLPSSVQFPVTGRLHFLLVRGGTVHGSQQGFSGAQSISNIVYTHSVSPCLLSL